MSNIKRSNVYFPPLVYLEMFSTFQLNELWKLRSISKTMLPVVENAILRLNPVHVLNTIDNLVSKMKIEDAVRLLIFFVVRSSYTKTSVILINRFIRLIQVNLSQLLQLKELRKEIIEILRSKAILELEGYPNKLSIDIQFDYHLKSSNETWELNINEKMPKMIPKEPTCTNQEFSCNLLIKNNFECLILFAYFLYKDDKYEKAYEICKFIIEKNKNHYLAYWLMGVLNHYYFKNFQASVMNYMRSIECEPRFAYARYSLGVVYHHHELGEEFTQCLYNQTLKLDPKHTCCLENLSFFNNIEETFELCRKAMSIDPYDITILDSLIEEIIYRDIFSEQDIDEFILISKKNIDILTIENKFGDRKRRLATEWNTLYNLYRKVKVNRTRNLFRQHECLVKCIELIEEDVFDAYDDIYSIEMEIRRSIPECDIPSDFEFIF